MKKALVSLLLLLFVFNTIGVQFLFFAERSLARTAMRERMKKEATRTMYIPVEDLAPSKKLFSRVAGKKNEIIYKGHLYDIVSEKTTGSFLVVTGYRDDKEDKAYRRFAENSAEQSRQPLKSMTVKTICDFIPDYTSIFDQVNPETKILSPVPFDQHPIEHAIAIPYPPPEFV